MHSFDILSRDETIDTSMLLEASAGTGKTFAIEQLIVRLILEKGFRLQEILAVTFTRAATREMKNRVRSNLEKLLHAEDLPDYFQAIQDKSLAQIQLSEALSAFDEAQIFTIHSFCHRLLTGYAFEAGAHFTLSSPDKPSHKSRMRELVRDFFQTDFVLETEAIEELLKKFRQDFESLVEGVVSEMENPRTSHPTLKKIGSACLLKWQQQSEQEGIMAPDELLQSVLKALENPAFLEKARGTIRAVIIDEFQDTDPIAWAIFQKLFLHTSCLLYLVGDPKQSIYGFRKADIHTYLRAANQMPKQAHLLTCYRSRPDLVDALNTLFTKASHWLSLLTYHPVLSGRKEARFPHEKPLQFFTAYCPPTRERTFPPRSLEEEQLFPFIANEAYRWHTQNGVILSEIAILVKDRYQAERLHDYLKACNLPSAIKRTRHIAETEAFATMEEILRATLHPYDKNAVKIASETLDFNLLHTQLTERGFGSFFALLGQFIDTSTLRPIAQVLLQSQKPPHQLLAWMNALKETDEEEEEAARIRQEEGSDKLPLMTLFASKGLEYEVVFALGLASRHNEEEPSEDREAEKMRQLYVALTRARECLYIPYLIDSKKHPPSSPIELFLTHIKNFDSFPQITLKPTAKPHFSFPNPTPSSTPSKPTHFTWPKTSLHSFTSLAPEVAPSDIMTRFLAQDFTQKTPHTLPLGTETGQILHDTLEKYFRTKRIEVTFPGWEEVIHQIIENTLNLTLPSGFTLRDIQESHVELEFLYPCSSGYIKGFADLVFRHQNRYYLIDWKSNWLGPSSDFYTPPHLNTAMQEHHYFLQANLYTEALRRYVKLFDNRPFETLFGGAYYVFLRGPAYLAVAYQAP